MKTHYSFYDPATGLFSGKQFLGDEESLALNFPEGMVAIEGQHDPLSKQVVNGRVVDYQPPSPGVDYEWNDTAKRWVLGSAAQQAIDDDTAARERLNAIDLASIRALREAAIGDKAAALQVLTDLEQEAVPLRLDVITTDQEASSS